MASRAFFFDTNKHKIVGSQTGSGFRHLGSVLPISSVSAPPITLVNRFDLMSALPPKADMCGATTDVRFGPKADIAANNGCVTKTIHSMTVSAISSRLCGIVKPSVFAALELITNSNFVARKTGRSAIFSPLSIRPV